MPSIRFPLKTVSPLINTGANKFVELRAASVIGQLRFWLRGSVGAQVIDSQQVYDIESSLLGSTNTASSVTMQIREHEAMVDKVAVLPHSQRKKFREDALVDNSQFELKLIFRPGTTLDPRLTQALSLWILLGGVGKRSRRMFGSLQLASRPRYSRDMQLDDDNFHEWWRNWEAIEQRPHLYPRLIKLTTDIIFNTNTQGTVRRSEPDFPILHDKYCRIIVSQKDFDNAVQANIALFSILRKDKYRSRHEYMFGSGSPRRASPLIAQGRVFDGKYYPVFTAFRSPIDGRSRADWDVFDQAMNEIEKEFNGQTVFGGNLNQ